MGHPNMELLHFGNRAATALPRMSLHDRNRHACQNCELLHITRFPCDSLRCLRYVALGAYVGQLFLEEFA